MMPSSHSWAFDLNHPENGALLNNVSAKLMAQPGPSEPPGVDPLPDPEDQKYAVKITVPTVLAKPAL